MDTNSTLHYITLNYKRKVKRTDDCTNKRTDGWTNAPTDKRRTKWRTDRLFERTPEQKVRTNTVRTVNMSGLTDGWTHARARARTRARAHPRTHALTHAYMRACTRRPCCIMSVHVARCMYDICLRLQGRRLKKKQKDPASCRHVYADRHAMRVYLIISRGFPAWWDNEDGWWSLIDVCLPACLPACLRACLPARPPIYRRDQSLGSGCMYLLAAVSARCG